jgi:hypothetical protein
MASTNLPHSQASVRVLDSGHTTVWVQGDVGFMFDFGQAHPLNFVWNAEFLEDEDWFPWVRTTSQTPNRYGLRICGRHAGPWRVLAWVVVSCFGDSVALFFALQLFLLGIYLMKVMCFYPASRVAPAQKSRPVADPKKQPCDPTLVSKLYLVDPAGVTISPYFRFFNSIWFCLLHY